MFSTQTAINMFISYGGLRAVEVGLKQLARQVKKAVGAKKYDKVVNVSRVAVKDILKTLNDVGATVALDKIKDAALKQVADKTRLPYEELDKFVDVAIEEIKESIIQVAEEDKTVTVTDVNTNTTQQVQ